MRKTRLKEVNKLERAKAQPSNSQPISWSSFLENKYRSRNRVRVRDGYGDKNKSGV